jgi:hypothetical protein
VTRRALAVALALGAAACGKPTAPIALHFVSSNASPGVGAGYNGEVGQAMVSTDGRLTLTSSAGGASLGVGLDKPSAPGKVMIGQAHIAVDYQLGQAGWSSNAGSVTFNTVDPYDITFDDLEMLSATPEAKGGFYLSGSGTFRTPTK